MLSREQLLAVMPNCGKFVDKFVGPLNDTMAAYDIDTPLRIAAFLSQIAQESGELRYMEEIASGAAYEDRTDLGNTQPGDGKRFKGHGLIQCTGRGNHQLYADYKGWTIDEALAYMLTPEGAADVSGWYWERTRCNSVVELADCRKVTRKVNGASTDHAPSHYLRRKAYFDRAKKVLGQ